MNFTPHSLSHDFSDKVDLYPSDVDFIESAPLMEFFLVVNQPLVTL